MQIRQGAGKVLAGLRAVKILMTKALEISTTRSERGSQAISHRGRTLDKMFQPPLHRDGVLRRPLDPIPFKRALQLVQEVQEVC
jgi:hypothetical protein